MAAKKKSSRRYGAKASKKVGDALHAEKRGKLISGGSGKRVKSRKQAIAIGLSEARKEGGKVPPKKGAKKKGAKKKGAKKKGASKKKAGAKRKSARKRR